MEFNYTKPLENKLEEYLKADIKDICVELLNTGFVYEDQFKSLNAMVCKQNANELICFFSEKTHLHILYAYNNSTLEFIFYDEERYDKKEAIMEFNKYKSK